MVKQKQIIFLMVALIPMIQVVIYIFKVFQDTGHLSLIKLMIKTIVGCNDES